MAPKKAAESVAVPAEDKALAKQDKEIVRLRNDETSWADIAEAMDMSQGKAMFRYMVATLADEDEITFTTEAALTKAIVKARDVELQSWGQISARTRGTVAEGKVRALYADATGKNPSDTRIGKGGRANGGAAEGAPAKAAKAAKAAPKKAAGGKKAAAASPTPADGAKLISEMNLDELQGRLNGATILVKTSPNKETRIKVGEIDDLTNGVISLSTAEGKDLKVKVAQIAKVSKVPAAV